MYFLICFILALYLSHQNADFIRKNSSKFYFAAGSLGFIDAILQFYWMSHNIRLQGFAREAESFFSRGILATAIIAVVMYMGALDNKKNYTKKLLSIRAELSIIACFLMLAHNAVYAYYSLMNLIKVIGAPLSNFKTVSLLISISGLVAVSLMLPLFITSFKKVRKKMAAKSWKKLQSLSYIFYFALYFQIMMVHLGYVNRRNYITALGYSIVFLSYAFLRIRKKYLQDAKRSTVQVR